MTAALQTVQLQVQLGGYSVLRGIDLQIQPGRWTCVVGPNGAGKSTLLKALAGLLPHSGQVLWQGQPLGTLSGRERALQLSWLGQGESTTLDLRVWDVVMLGRLPHQGWLGSPTERDAKMVEAALKATQAWVWRERTLGELSGGERQRVLLARAMAGNAPVMLMDEPLANLDPPHQVDWLEQVHCLRAQGTTVVSVLHEIGMALHADEVLVMDQGQVIHHGACSDLASHAAIEAVFGHRIRIHALNGQWVVLPCTAGS
ncbi:ABC transporter ATP-binding protein [Limnohabitans radicicola]|uniref:ABC transporter ATP-binding protein n=1 Tax=Limnohabitans radicicola TaxID=2771427 RepID=A0A927FGB2_9BURK|nr:ABC transporter ATP-binding protein [Limnohabitans radicicola]MBD8050919.1 ABC transporter ATP-binding protein [Limnohabitans radicicola]